MTNSEKELERQKQMRVKLDNQRRAEFSHSNTHCHTVE